MKWLRLVGSPKILVSFAKEPHKRDLFSAKETNIFKEPSIHSHLIYIYSNMLRWYVFYVCIIVHAFDPVSQAPFAKLSAMSMCRTDYPVVMYIFATSSAVYIRSRLPHPLLYIYGIPLWLYTYS